jgi:putative hydrolase of the HAD superfamily
MAGSVDIKNYRAVIFDLFHTLTSLESVLAPGRQTHEILGSSRGAWNNQLISFSDDRLRGRLKDPFEIIKRLAHAVDPGIAEGIIREATKIRLARFKYAIEHIDQGVIETIRSLRTSGKVLGLISNCDVNEVGAWEMSPISKYFDCVIFSCYTGYVKPERNIYEICLKELNVSPEDSIFVGDGGSDELKGAKEVGMTTVLTTHVIKYLWPEKIEERRKYADYEIDGIDELFGCADC